MNCIEFLVDLSSPVLDRARELGHENLGTVYLYDGRSAEAQTPSPMSEDGNLISFLEELSAEPSEVALHVVKTPRTTHICVSRCETQTGHGDFGFEIASWTPSPEDVRCLPETW